MNDFIPLLKAQLSKPITWKDAWVVIGFYLLFNLLDNII